MSSGGIFIGHDESRNESELKIEGIVNGLVFRLVKNISSQILWVR